MLNKMAHRTVRLMCFVALLAAVTPVKEQTRWSRQISSYTADISDWVPLAGPVERETRDPHPLPPIKRQAVAEPRILTEPFPGFTRPSEFSQDSFPQRMYFNSPANRQLYLQSVPSAPQNYLSDQGFGQSVRFGLSQPNFPLSQGFIAPQYTFDSIPAGPPLKPRPPPQLAPSPVKFESFTKQGLPSSQTKPFISQSIKTKTEPPKFIDGYRADNISNDFAFNQKKKVQSLQKIKFENYDKNPKIETIPSRPKVEREEVQLLYVPIESLNRGQYNFGVPLGQAQNINKDLYTQNLPKPNPLKQAFSSEIQKPIAKPVESFNSNQAYFSNYDQAAKFSTISTPFPTSLPVTPKPKKLKPHQPPLAIFMSQDSRKRNPLKVGDVLSLLKNANTVAVLDTVNPLNAPKVFIGPSTLNPPDNFVKFELPYLSNIENSDKKLRQLPFFVAPLSYNTPNGFAKIPFPSPHVGSVVINSQIRDSGVQANSAYSTQSTPAANIIPNSYTATPQKQNFATQKPQFSYYSTAAPSTNAPNNQHLQSNYYALEQQTVTAIPPQKQEEANINALPPKPESYFLTNVGNQYNPTKYVSYPTNIKQEPLSQYNFAKPETSTTPKTTVTTTTTSKPPSTYSSQLLETHNPYSINQAFHFSTPLDYHSYYDDLKEPFVNQGVENTPKISPSPTVSLSNVPNKPEDVVTEKQLYQQQTSPNYLQNYTPEIHYESEGANSRHPVYNGNDYTTKTQVSSENYKIVNQPEIEPVQHNQPNLYNAVSNQPTTSQETAIYDSPTYENLTEININKINTPIEDNGSQYYNQYETNYQTDNVQHSSSTSSSTTTTTRRTPPIRTRGRPRYTTARPDSGESTTVRSSITRRPLKERRPLPSRTKYEPNKITTERTTRKSLESVESTTKYSRTRTRGRIHYKPSENDEYYSKKNKIQNNKQEDLAYQRDVLHQNYPVTLMERMSTVDIEAMTEPAPNFSSTKTMGNEGEVYDTENAYAHQSASISYLQNVGSSENTPIYSSETEYQTEAAINSKLPLTRNEDYIYQSRSSVTPIEAISSFEDANEKQDIPKPTTAEMISYTTERTSSTAEEYLPNQSINNEFSTKQEDSLNEEVNTKISSQETHETETEETVVQTTPSYNRVRIRPGVIRQYHHASSTESTRAKSERKKIQAITHRPAYDRRRTTMRIEEIEADLKTKQIHSRTEFQDHKHPVYRPEPTTESIITTPFESTTKRGHFRRRRPGYTTTSTEATSTKKNVYETKNRFRGRRPTEKPTEKHDVKSETTTTTVRTSPHQRYSHRPRLSERYNKKPDNNAEETEDQESNYSINRPKYVTPENDQWSPKISGDSFKPYNPNDIVEDSKLSTTEHRNTNAALDIITARNDYDDILISVTPATNTRAIKKIPDIPPTLEALVEQSKTTKMESSDSMSTFETMLEEVMKNLEEQDEDEYTSNVMKHKGGEIGEIPPEKIITTEDEYIHKATASEQEITTTVPVDYEETDLEKAQPDHKGRRRGYWKKVKVRPISTETIETAESQYYTNTVNRLGEPITSTKNLHDKTTGKGKSKIAVTTYKPSNLQFIKDFFETEIDDENLDGVIPTVDIPKIVKKPVEVNDEANEKVKKEYDVTTEKIEGPGEIDLGTGSPDPTIMDSMYYSTPTEPTSTEGDLSLLDRSDSFSLMDYFFGTTTESEKDKVKNKTTVNEIKQKPDVVITTERVSFKLPTTENNYVPEEITTILSEDNIETVTDFTDSQKINDDKQEQVTESVKVKSSSESSFMNPANVVSTSMSTEISHETEICFRGKCIKTNKDIL
ncbi:unnamed protein product [Diatraea saccharalis]|uniref:Uncharacterized protein n=1 Tax=Diatraea saccharalis TaxID=40085 RepID=A0A9N9WI01_9NEOP|nr:unnamed protein product [Diatraea saccharalis]